VSERVLKAAHIFLPVRPSICGEGLAVYPLHAALCPLEARAPGNNRQIGPTCAFVRNPERWCIRNATPIGWSR